MVCGIIPFYVLQQFSVKLTRGLRSFFQKSSGSEPYMYPQENVRPHLGYPVYQIHFILCQIWVAQASLNSFCCVFGIAISYGLDDCSKDRLCGLVVRALATDPKILGSIPSLIRFSDK
jgi:hypothetical protein